MTCPHALQVWLPAPHPRYGTARPHFVAGRVQCGGRFAHEGEHERFGRRWR